MLEFFAFEPGEARPALLLTLYLLLAVASMIALKAASKALYLAPDRFHPRSLPYVYVVTAVAVSFVVSIYIKLAARLRQDQLLINTQLFFASNLVFFWWLLRMRPKWAAAGLIVWTGMYAVILVSQVWTLANHIFTTRQARRLFSIISSGGILGCALGGQFSSLMTRRVGAQNLLLVYVPFLLACAVIVGYLWRSTQHPETASSSKSKQAAGPSNLAESVRAIRGSRYLSLIALLVFVSAVVGVLVDFQFTYIVKHAVPDPDKMTAFLSDFYSYMAVLSFLMHVILSSRVMRMFGLNFAIFILPVAMLFGSTVLVLSAGLLAGVLIKGFDQGFRHSIDRSATELLYVPLPARLRQQAKSFIDMVAARWADGVGGLLLIPLAGHDLLNLTMQQLAWVNVALVVPWLGVAWKLRREYVNTLRSSIERKDISAEALLMEMATSSPTESIAATLASSDDRAVETGLGLLQYGEASLASAQLGSLLMHMSPAIRRKALAIVAAKGVPDCAPQVSVFLFLESDVDSLWKALDYVERYDPEENYVKLKDLLDAPHAVLRGTAAARLLGRADSPDRAKAHEVFHAFIASALQDQPAYRQPAAEVLGLAPSDLDCQAALADLLRDPDPVVVRAAASSAGRARQQSLVAPLLGLLADRRFRSEARRALAAFGPEVLPQLQRALLDPQFSVRARRELPRVFAMIGGQEAAASLAASLTLADLDLQRQILRALSRIRLRDPQVRLDGGRINPLTEKELRNYYKYLGILQVVPANGTSASIAFLRRALAEQLGRKLEVIFRLIGLLYPPKDIFDAYYGISSGRRDLRANALEFLDSMLLNPVRQMLLPVIEDRSPDRVLEYGRALFGFVLPTYRQALGELLAESDPWLQSCAAHAAADQGLAELEPLLEPLAGSDEPLLAETVRAARQRFRSAAAKS
ncbi:MAG TPA: Npt1/Npt2 family nucleotide transporter [Bryobacterales bacterium]|nr:Npt1/Npt2 family nucleotide transporter [Bryobacterales bacterium]